MLADEVVSINRAGQLDSGIHRPEEWLSSLIEFIAGALPDWRDDPARKAETSETHLTTQLCARLNSRSRHAPGWDILQFRREDPDEVSAGRAIDLVAAPSGETIVIGGREYNEYQPLLPIECKRLPTPAGNKRDEREYLVSKFSSTGGVHRFKDGHHGSNHKRAAMIGYLQNQDIVFWQGKMDVWIDGIVGDGMVGWSASDKLSLVGHDKAQRFAALQSRHERAKTLDHIQIDHLWIEM
ncbi:MAG: hypothetical protein ABS35_32185 [Kaistia sp. SCN 65-12]|nr:MAG: hypothetical protein ABS35_32185 [Kaistia sp. SCN 65-12]